MAGDGITRLDPPGPLPADAPFDVQARQVLANVRAAVEGAGSSLDRVLKCTVYVSDIADWPAFNALYAELFGAHRPARAVVPVAPLHYGYRVEMDAIAAVD
ncbi:MAG: RidA family protein [Gemmatimonadales bacterium]|nr:RidA family protein [Gemmatimonadales bacterium]